MTDHHLTRGQIMQLAAYRGTPAVSMYIPSAKTGSEVQQGPIRLKNMLADAEERLSVGMRPTLARDFLLEASALVGDSPFWSERCNGVALFVGPELFRAYHLAFEVEECLVVAQSFHVRPLLAELRGCPSYDVLSLDRKDIRLLHCTPFSVSEVRVEHMPHSYESFFALDYSEKQSQFHSAGRTGAAGSVIRHGAGDPGADESDRLRRFCVAIDHAIVPHLNLAQKPLILVGTAEIQDAYRSVSRYPFLLPNGIERSPNRVSPEAMADLARPIADEYADRPRRQLIKLYKQTAGTGLTSQQVEQILPAAHAGRVEALFIPHALPTWGWYDPDSATAMVHEEYANGDEDLVNRAAAETLAHHGQLYDLDPDDLVLTGPAAALFRY